MPERLRIRVALPPTALQAVRAISKSIRLVHRATRPAVRSICAVSERITAPTDLVSRRLTAAVQTANTFVREYQRWLRDTEEGRELADLLTIGSRSRAEDERLTAARRTAARFPTPIDRRRWPEVSRRLGDEARQHGWTRERELEERTISTLFLVVNGQPDDAAIPGIDDLPFDPASIRDYVKRGLNREMTSDLLGPSWRGSDVRYGKQYHRALSQLPGGAESEVTRREKEGYLFVLLKRARCTSSKCSGLKTASAKRQFLILS